MVFYNSLLLSKLMATPHKQFKKTAKSGKIKV
jgi:hypothetical protein